MQLSRTIIIKEKPVVILENIYADGSMTELRTDTGKVTVLHVATTTTGKIIKSLYSQEYKEYEEYFINN
jgi:hypothetical protein